MTDDTTCVVLSSPSFVRVPCRPKRQWAVTLALWNHIASFVYRPSWQYRRFRGRKEKTFIPSRHTYGSSQDVTSCRVLTKPVFLIWLPRAQRRQDGHPEKIVLSLTLKKSFVSIWTWWCQTTRHMFFQHHRYYSVPQSTVWGKSMERAQEEFMIPVDLKAVVICPEVFDRDLLKGMMTNSRLETLESNQSVQSVSK